MSSAGSLDPRVAELLSAYLDGAVTDEERSVAQQWLERSADARAEYESLAAVKATLGGLGAVEPPFGFFERMLQQGTPTAEVISAVDRAADRATERAGARSRPRSQSRRSAATVALALVASAAAFVVVGGGAAPDRSVRPPIEAVAAGDADGLLRIRGASGSIRALRQEADGVRWDELPDGVRRTGDGADVWEDLTTDDGDARVVVFRDGVVVTVFGEGAEAAALVDEAIEIVEQQPAPEPSLGERVREAFGGLLDALSP